MDTTGRFDIVFRKRMPLFNSTLDWIIVLFAVTIGILYMIMTPSRSVSPEMRVGYYILAVPEWLKTSSGFALVGLLVLLPISHYSRKLQSGKLLVDTERLSIESGPNKQIVPWEVVTTISINDIHRFGRTPIFKTEIVIKALRAVSVSFLLSDYSDTEKFVELILKQADIDVRFYQEMSLASHD